MGGCLPSYPQQPESSYNSHTSALDSKKPGAHFKNWTYAETHNQNNVTSPEGGKVHQEKKERIEEKVEKGERRKSRESDGGSGDEGDHGDRADIRH